MPCRNPGTGLLNLHIQTPFGKEPFLVGHIEIQVMGGIGLRHDELLPRKYRL
jgi:hypothetical protein